MGDISPPASPTVMPSPERPAGDNQPWVFPYPPGPNPRWDMTRQEVDDRRDALRRLRAEPEVAAWRWGQDLFLRRLQIGWYLR